jgi:hypothetical protein
VQCSVRDAGDAAAGLNAERSSFSSLRGANDEAIHNHHVCLSMDCFAEPVIGRIRATRWLAMTVSNLLLTCNHLVAYYHRHG